MLWGKKIRIILADNKFEERAALRRLLGQDCELQVMGEADKLESLLARVQNIRPNLVLLDW